MKIESIRLKNFKTFRDVEITDIPNFCVFIGANGSGKSTFFSVFGFLQDAMTGAVNSALTKLGGSRGILEVRSRNTAGPVEIELKLLTGKILAEGAIPRHEVRDAAHIAVSGANNMNYLLTWNCKHMANAQIIRRISVICNRHGYHLPVICTPEELMGE